MVANALLHVPGGELVSGLQLCSMQYTLGVENIDDLCDDVDDVGFSRLYGIITIFKNDSYLQQVRSEQQACLNEWVLVKVRFTEK